MQIFFWVWPNCSIAHSRKEKNNKLKLILYRLFLESGSKTHRKSAILCNLLMYVVVSGQTPPAGFILLVLKQDSIALRHWGSKVAQRFLLQQGMWVWSSVTSYLKKENDVPSTHIIRLSESSQIRTQHIQVLTF